MDILEIQNVSKGFGNQPVIEGLSFSVEEHSVFGFVGQNGAGKTTTMKMVLGLLSIDSGSISVCGEKVSFGQTRTNRFVGYLPDVPEFYGYMRPKEYLKLCGEITGLSRETIQSRSQELLSLVGLWGVDKKIGGFSRGMKQRLGIAQALLNEPKLLICDEPTSALDPLGRKEILEILRQVRRRTTVVFSTHILSDVERICDQVAVLHHGKLALSGTLPELRSRHRSDRLLVEFAGEKEKSQFISTRKLMPYLMKAEQTSTSVLFHDDAITTVESLVLESLSAKGILPTKLELLEPTIESLFLEAVQ